MKLSTRLILLTAILVLVATSAVGFFAYRALEQTVYPAELTRMTADARLMAERLSATVREAGADVIVNANTPPISGIINALAEGDENEVAVWKERLTHIFRAGLLADPQYVQIRFIAASDGRELVRVHRAPDGKAIVVVPEEQLQTKAQRSYVRETLALTPGSLYYSPIELNREYGEVQTPHMPVIRVASPVAGADGNNFGIIVINVDLRPAFDRLRAAGGPEVAVYMVNEQGDYLIHPDREKEFGFDLAQPAHLQDDFPDLWQALTPGSFESSTSLTVEDASDARFAAAVNGRYLAGEIWAAVLLLAPRAVILAPADAILYSVLGAGAAAIVVAVLLSLLLARTVTRPLDQLTRSIGRLDRGEAVHLPAQGPSEIGILVTAFRHHIERERLFTAAVQNSSDAVLTVSLDGTITAWNGAAEKLYGYTMEEAVGQPVRMLAPDDRMEEFEQISKRLYEGQATEALETVRVAKDARRLLVSLAVSPVRSLDGKIVGASAISRDITEQKQAEAMFRLAVEASPAALIMIDCEGRIVLANAETLSMFGYERDELLGKTVETLIPQRFRAEHPGLRQDFGDHPSKRMMGHGRDLYGLRRDSTEFPVEVGLSPIDSPIGPVVLSLVVDIAARKEADEQLARRTAELQRSNAELQQFAYVASHDLQEPLRMVSSFCELLKERYADRLDGEAVEFIDFAVDGARRMRQLIGDLLDYSRLQTREVTLGAVSATRAVEMALLNLAAVVSETGAEVDIGDLPSVSGNDGQLTHLFQNLIGNALKFTKPEEVPKISIAAEAKGPLWEFSVKDNGIGMDPKQTELIFGVFQRLHTRDEYPGTGIGLALCKRIVERHGGAIWVDSRPGEGATFRFTLKSVADAGKICKTGPGVSSASSEEDIDHARRAG